MGSTPTVLKIQTDQSGIIEQLEQENKLLKEFIGNSSIDEINRLKNIEKQLAVCQAQLAEKEQAYADLKAESDKRVKMARESAERLAEDEKNRAVKKNSDNVKYDIRKNEVKPLKKEVEQKEKEIESLKVTNEDLMKQHEKTHLMLQEVLEKQDRILEILSSSSTIEEARQEVKKIVSPGKYSDDEKDAIIHQAIQDKKSNKEVSEELGISTVRISQILGTKRYINKYGKEGFR